MAYRSNRYDNRRPNHKKPPEARSPRPPSLKRERFDFEKEIKREIREGADHSCLRCGIDEVHLDLIYSTACDACDLADKDKNCSDGCNITADCHLEAHHIVPRSRAEENPKFIPEVVRSPAMAAYLCHDCHQILDHLALNASDEELLELHELGKENLSIEMIRELIRTAEPGSYSAQVFCVWYNRAVIIHNRKLKNRNNQLEASFYPQPPRILLRTAQAKAFVREQQMTESLKSRGRKQQPQRQYYELR